MEATLGAGSEMMIDVAPGADWTAMVAVVMALQQVGWRGGVHRGVGSRSERGCMFVAGSQSGVGGGHPSLTRPRCKQSTLWPFT